MHTTTVPSGTPGSASCLYELLHISFATELEVFLLLLIALLQSLCLSVLAPSKHVDLCPCWAFHAESSINRSISPCVLRGHVTLQCQWQLVQIGCGCLQTTAFSLQSSSLVVICVALFRGSSLSFAAAPPMRLRWLRSDLLSSRDAHHSQPSRIVVK